jgi:hypothetical protein
LFFFFVHQRTTAATASMGKRGPILASSSSNDDEEELSDDDTSIVLSSRARSSQRGRSVQKKASTKKKKSLQKKRSKKVIASDAANSTLTLMAAAKKSVVCAKKFNAGGRTICWSWSHWRPADAEQHGSDAINAERLASLKALKPKLECIHCSKKMSWEPSTKRKLHLCLGCIAFAASPFFNDARVVADRDDILRKRGEAANVRS